MADDTTDTTPGDAPDVIKTGSDGSLPEDLGGRRAWVWMQDTPDGGGGRFDVLASRVGVWRRKGATVVPNYPVHFGPSGRTAKPAANLGGGNAGAEGQQPAAPTLSDQPTGDAGPPDTVTLSDQPADDAGPTNSATLAAQPSDEAAAADTTTTRTKGGRTR
ncbi:hypothetical protein AB0A95_30650 [Micromonospora sp. NPDC049230]|uniref:hypothetical protein n=1 Tax=Micromonospora sp. NPDC049230 TaxID=3155502 RepID=UPI0033D6E645